jgi:lipoprotein-anchoring transpeptidase ErfK/SrfK
MSRISALRAFAFAAIAGAAFTTAASANPLVLGYAPQDQRSVETMTEPNEGFQQVARFKRQIVSYYTTEAPGTIIIDTPNTYLYLVLGNGRALRYGIGVGREGFTWSGTQTITKKAEWPDWHPPQEMIERQPYLPRFMAGGPGNPLGARAMYLGGTVYRIHGTNAPETIGHQVSSGCIRLVNEDVMDLYSRVNVGAKVVVLPMSRGASRISALH